MFLGKINSANQRLKNAEKKMFCAFRSQARETHRLLITIYTSDTILIEKSMNVVNILFIYIYIVLTLNGNHNVFIYTLNMFLPCLRSMRVYLKTHISKVNNKLFNQSQFN